jgi:hypothetical protein
MISISRSQRKVYENFSSKKAEDMGRRNTKNEDKRGKFEKKRLKHKVKSKETEESKKKKDLLNERLFYNIKEKNF